MQRERRSASSASLMMPGDTELRDQAPTGGIKLEYSSSSSVLNRIHLEQVDRAVGLRGRRHAGSEQSVPWRCHVTDPLMSGVCVTPPAFCHHR